MNKKKLVVLAFIFLLISVFSFYYALKPSNIKIDLSDPAYSYLPESAKIFIEKEAKKGNKVLTEKNKENGKVYLNPKYVEYLSMDESEKSKVEVIPLTYTYDYVTLKTASATTYPSYYKLNNLTIKDQKSLGICWAFSIISSVETNILKTGLSSNVVNFSERQLDYVMADAITEINNPYSMAKIKTSLDTYYDVDQHALGTGSNSFEAYMYFNMGLSPVKSEIWGEYDTSYKTRPINEVLNTDNVDYIVSSYATYGDNIYNNSVYSDSYKKSFMNQLKKHITDFGSLYVVTPSPDSTAGSCYDSSLNLITYDEDNTDCRNSVYHAMSIVGWNDDYNGGAWILKNSWGSNLPYVYLSYYSDFFDITGVIKTDAKNWDNSYNFTKTNTSTYTYNSYEITYNKSSEFKENLEKINFVSWGLDSTYRVYYKNGTGSYKLLGSITNDLPGLVTFNVSNVLLDKDTFSIKITTDDGFIDGGLNAFTSNVVNDKYMQEYHFTNSSKPLPKQLIVRNVESGTKVNYHVYDEYGKQYNTNSESYVVNGTVDIDYTLPTLQTGNYYLTLNDNFFDINVTDKIELKVDNTYQIEYEIGSNLNVRTITYSVLDPSIASVSNTGLVTALKSGKTTIKININDNIIIPIELVTFKESNIEYLKILDQDQTFYMSLVDEFDIHIDMKPTTYGLEDLSWTSSDKTVATVENGHVSFLKSGYVTITVSSGALSDEIHFTILNSISNVTLYADKTTIAVGEEVTLSHSQTGFGYRYSVSDEDILRVRNGVVTGLKNGTAWVYYKKTNSNSVAGIKFNVVDQDLKMNLTIDPNGGTYNDSTETTIIQKNSLETYNLNIPSYNVRLTLVNGEESEFVDISHEFNGFNLLGYGTLNNRTYTFGFGNGILTALWKYTKYTLPTLTKEGMNFAGWYKDQEFTEFVGKNIEYIPKEDITLYAKFTEGKTGDINNDGEIDITDLVILGRYLVGLEEIDDNLLGLADINHDGEIDITDLVILGRYLVGLEEIN